MRCVVVPARFTRPPKEELHFIVLSDTHVGSEGDAARLGRLMPLLACERPDFILHGGDLVNDGVGTRPQLVEAERLLSRLPAPVHLVPGNHDIGMARSLAASRRWRDAFGPTEFVFEYGDWRVIGFNSMALTRACGNPSLENEVLEFLESQVAPCQGRRVVLLFHLPPIIVPHHESFQAPWTQSATHRFERFMREVEPVATVAGHWHVPVRLPLSTGELTVAPAVSGRWRLPTGYLRCRVREGRLVIERVMVEAGTGRVLPLVVQMVSLPEGALPTPEAC